MPDMRVRERLDQLISESGESYASISRLIGRNPAYVQQFIRRGIPRRLDEMDRKILARHFNVPEEELGGLPSTERPNSSHSPEAASPAPDTARLQPHSASQYISVPMIASRSGERDIMIATSLARSLVGEKVEALKAWLMEGDAMSPTLLAGDQLLIDTSDRIRVRDGIYMLGPAAAMLVKRLATNPATGRITIFSDNAAYPSYPDCDPHELQLMGRVLWVGRQLR